MKKTILFIMVLCVSVMLQAQVSKTIANLTAGGLKSQMTAEELNTVTKLTLLGTMDARDFTVLREDMPALAEIDLTNIIIAEYTGTGGTGGNWTITYPANTIPEFAMEYKKTLTSIALPVSITTIGNYAFYCCFSLASINLPSSIISIGNLVFYRCSSLASINLPSSLISIGNFVFDACSSLTSVNLPSSVTTIGEYAFANCTSLTSVILPNSLTKIGKLAFEECTALTSIIIPVSVTMIGFEAFYNCTSLEAINIPASVTSIEDGAFLQCKAFITVDSENINYSSIDGVLFNKDKTDLILCSGFQNGDYTVPSSVKTIHKLAFYGSLLTSVILPTSVNTIGEAAFQDCDSLKSVILSNSLTTIGQSAFYDCISLTLVSIPNSVISIGDESFRGCAKLNSVIIPNSVTSIGNKAFFGCWRLRSVTIPASVTSIGELAFAQCEQLANIYIYNPIPVVLLPSSYVFDGDKNTCTLYVPSESLDLYKAADVWKDFTKIGIITSKGKEIENEVFSVSPNPAKDVITVHAQKGVASIYNSNGKLEITQPLEENKQVNISSLKTGMYVVKVNGESFKIIKE